MNAIKCLKEMWTHLMPVAQSAAHVSLQHTPRTCCFDAAGVGHLGPGFAKHTICERCRLLNQLLQGE